MSVPTKYKGGYRYFLLLSFCICPTFKDCQLIFKPFWGPVNRHYGNSSSHMRSHMLVLSVSLLGMVLTQLPFLVFLLLVNSRTQVRIASFPLLSSWETNVSRLELFVSRVRFRWEAVRAHKVRPLCQPWRFQEVACIKSVLARWHLCKCVPSELVVIH